MDKEVLIKNIVYLNEKERTLNRLKKAQVRRIAARVRDRLHGLAVLDREGIGDTLRAVFTYDPREEALTTELCRELARQMPELTAAVLFPAHEEVAETPTVSYMKNAHSERAFHAFAAHMPALGAVPATTHADCCGDVYESNSDYCILPLFTGKDGILTSFCALAEQHELAVHALARVEMAQTGDYTLFALMKRRCEYLGHASHFAFAIHEDLLPQCGEILCALKKFGARPVKVAPVPLGKESSGFLYLLVADIVHADLTALLLYLEITVPSYLPYGLFERI
ncbi:MAG: hypothetical protein J6D21_08860 [Clostridia bacterium]|nr:hypothetical protein [Clostridia bacterium]